MFPPWYCWNTAKSGVKPNSVSQSSIAHVYSCRHYLAGRRPDPLCTVWGTATLRGQLMWNCQDSQRYGYLELSSQDNRRYYNLELRVDHIVTIWSSLARTPNGMTIWNCLHLTVRTANDMTIWNWHLHLELSSQESQQYGRLELTEQALIVDYCRHLNWQGLSIMAISNSLVWTSEVMTILKWLDQCLTISNSLILTGNDTTISN